MTTIMTVEKMMGFLYELPEQFADSLKMDFDSGVGKYTRHYENIVVSGLGGSAIGGDILRTYAAAQAVLPIIVNRSYNIPAFVNENTLFFAVSYSGNTEETLSAYKQARSQGASIICCTSGGKLAQMAEEDGNALIRVPAGLVPRAAVGYLFAPVGIALERLGIINGVAEELEETVEVLRNLRKNLNPNINMPDNQARIIAEKIKGTIPVIWGASGISEAVALRWKAQINENAKSPAYYNNFPELNHNEIVGFEAPDELLSCLTIILLEDRYDDERIKKRMNITTDIVKNKVNNILKVKSHGESFLARLFSLVYIGDYASVYLALEYGINPTPVDVIDYLKAELAR